MDSHEHNLHNLNVFCVWNMGMLIDVITAKKSTRLGGMQFYGLINAILLTTCAKKGGTGAVRLQIHDYFLTVCSLGNIHNHAIGYLCRLGI